ncbi:uncharacterized protein C20orf85 homolog, partial [Thrips palmi]|uniref:Uncharacterized protein C20orf85 homolog n=1 Tax=Thrips palmi TaxID=161013 RepID=A0A6P8ZXJ5_THRPL
SVAGLAGEGEGDRDDILQEAAKRMSLAAPLAERQQDRDTLGVGPHAGRGHANKVLQDGILKEKVQLQELTRKTWQRKWGFLADQEQAFKQEAAAADVDHRRVGLRAEPRTLKLVDAVLPSPPIPRLSSGLVGWRSSQPELTLERVGALYKSPLRTIDPPEAPGDVPRTRQSFIFLG